VLAVATGKSRRGLDEALEQTGLASLFAVTRTADETRSKPHPRMLEEILQVLDLPPRAGLHGRAGGGLGRAAGRGAAFA